MGFFGVGVVKAPDAGEHIEAVYQFATIKIIANARIAVVVQVVGIQGGAVVFENHISPKFLKYNVTQLYDMPLGQFKNQIRNNFVDLFVPSRIATTNALSHLVNKIQKISRRLDPNIYNEEDYIDKDFYDIDEIEEMYKNYNIMNLCNTYIEGLGYDDEMKQKLKDKLKDLYTQCAYNYDITDR